MKFKPGENRIRRGGKVYIKDAITPQVNPVQKEIKPKKDESVQHKPVVQEPVPTRSKPKRKQSRSGSKGNRSSDSGS